MNGKRAMSRQTLRIALAAALVAGLIPSALALTQAQRDWLSARLAANAAGRYSAPALTPVGASAVPVADALVEWDRLRRPGYQPRFDELSRFLLAHPGWPQESDLRARAERAVDASTPFAQRLAFFTRYEPETAAGMLRYAEALIGTGQRDAGAQWVRKAWAARHLPPELEGELLRRYGSLLTPADHIARADALLWAKNPGGATRMLSLLPAEARAWATARIHLQQNSMSAPMSVAAVPAAYASDPGLLLDRARYMNENRDPLGARRLLANAAIAQGTPLDPVAWMRFRHDLARDARRDRQYDIAYRLAAEHRSFPLGRELNDRSYAERDAFTDMEWMAGQIALNELRRPADALKHFARYGAGSQTPTTATKGWYWAARAADAAGQPEVARRYWRDAAAHPDTFYGQLAHERLGEPVRLALASPVVTPAERARWEADEVVRAAAMLGEIGDRTRQSLFMRTLAERARTPGERTLVALLAPQLDRRDLGVIVGKRGRVEGDGVMAFAYPRLTLPSMLESGWTMIHAITRQESQFYREAVSSAGARGLMQLMPGTAREVAPKVGVSYDFDRLTRDETYNVMLGSTYYRNLLDQWGGNHVLAVASYNAGPGNVRRWVRENGDPRNPGVDVVAWIEAIPFSETRNYVQRVLENAVVYDLLRRSEARTPETNRLSGYLGRARAG